MSNCQENEPSRRQGISKGKGEGGLSTSRIGIRDEEGDAIQGQDNMVGQLKRSIRMKKMFI